MEGYTHFTSGLFSLYFLRKPIGYITNILMSNTTSKYYLIMMMLSGGVLGFWGALQTRDSPLFRYFRPERYLSFNNRPEHILPFNYENLRTPTQTVFTPIIESDVVKGSPLKLFIPIIERENDQVGLTELPISDKFKFTRAQRDSIRRENLLAYQAFHQIAVNDSVYTDLVFHYYQHPHADDDGLLVYIPTDDFKHGRNLLQIRKNYFLDSIQKIVTIPFYYEAEK